MGFWESFKEGYEEAINMKCPNCKNSISSYDGFCPKCGFQLKDTICSECGVELVKDAKFCQECGNKTKK